MLVRPTSKAALWVQGTGNNNWIPTAYKTKQTFVGPQLGARGDKHKLQVVKQ
jgi:hypothetical protein